MWEATPTTDKTTMNLRISIHASRVGGDTSAITRIARPRHFNPRLPCGRRPTQIRCTKREARFQSTPPVWEATVIQDICNGRGRISIHASRVGGDLCMLQPHTAIAISIHASRVGGDAIPALKSGTRKTYFNPRLPCGRRPLDQVRRFRALNFNPRLPCGRRLPVLHSI